MKTTPDLEEVLQVVADDLMESGAQAVVLRDDVPHSAETLRTHRAGGRCAIGWSAARGGSICGGVGGSGGEIAGRECDALARVDIKP